MKSFDEWFLENGIPMDTDFNVASRAYQAGQQSKQAEIDELQKRIDEALKTLNDASPTMLDKKTIRTLKGTNQ